MLKKEEKGSFSLTLLYSFDTSMRLLLLSIYTTQLSGTHLWMCELT